MQALPKLSIYLSECVLHEMIRLAMKMKRSSNDEHFEGNARHRILLWFATRDFGDFEPITEIGHTTPIRINIKIEASSI